MSLPSVRSVTPYGRSHNPCSTEDIPYSILGTCRLLGLNPVTYLADIVPTLTRGVERDDIAALMPKAWLLAHPKAAMAPLR